MTLSLKDTHWPDIDISAVASVTLVLGCFYVCFLGIKCLNTIGSWE